MGSKLTKMMSNDDFATSKASVEITTNDINIDPRSPRDSRTPITLIPIVPEQPNEVSKNYGPRRRLFKDLFVDINAVPPLSSLAQISNDETDAFEVVKLEEISSTEKKNMEHNVENIATNNKFSDDSSMEFHSFCDAENMPHMKIQTEDPRSPSFGIERSPLILEEDTDDNETGEDTMLETMFATLSLKN